MSRERELLLVALDFLDPRGWSDPSDQHVLNTITRDIEELLAQPEHIKRSPLTEAEISKTLKLSRRSTEWDYGFEAGVGFAEEFHGIDDRDLVEEVSDES